MLLKDTDMWLKNSITENLGINQTYNNGYVRGAMVEKKKDIKVGRGTFVAWWAGLFLKLGHDTQRLLATLYDFSRIFSVFIAYTFW